MTLFSRAMCSVSQQLISTTQGFCIKIYVIIINPIKVIVVYAFGTIQQIRAALFESQLTLIQD